MPQNNYIRILFTRRKSISKNIRKALSLGTSVQKCMGYLVHVIIECHHSSLDHMNIKKISEKKSGTYSPRCILKCTGTVRQSVKRFRYVIRPRESVVLNHCLRVKNASQTTIKVTIKLLKNTHNSHRLTAGNTVSVVIKKKEIPVRRHFLLVIKISSCTLLVVFKVDIYFLILLL